MDAAASALSWYSRRPCQPPPTGPAAAENKPGVGVIDVTYASSSQGNGFADWQNSTMLVVMRSATGDRLWTGEYNYKGGMEMSGFRVTTPEEAAKLTVQRIANQFEKEIRR